MFRLFLMLGMLGAVPGAMAQPAPASAPAHRTAPPALPSARAAATPAKVDLNLGTLEDLQTLPGIGPARAQALIDHRPYASVAEATTRGGLPRSVFDTVQDRLEAFQVNVNGASREEMIRLLPSIGDARADGIVRGRPYGTLDELTSKGGVPQAVLSHLRPVLRLH